MSKIENVEKTKEPKQTKKAAKLLEREIKKQAKAEQEKQTKENNEKKINSNKRFLEKVSKNKVNKDMIKAILKENDRLAESIIGIKEEEKAIGRELVGIKLQQKQIEKNNKKIETLKRNATKEKYRLENTKLRNKINLTRLSLIPQEILNHYQGRSISIERFDNIINASIEALNKRVKDVKSEISRNKRKISYREKLTTSDSILTSDPIRHQLKSKVEEAILPNGVKIQFNDSMNRYHMSNFTRNTSGSLVALFEDIRETRKYLENRNSTARVREITFVFTNRETGKAEYRTIPITRTASMESFENAIYYMVNGLDPQGRTDQVGSDPIDIEKFKLNENFFSLKYYTQVNPMSLLGKRKIKDYIFAEVEKTIEGCCFIDAVDRQLKTEMKQEDKMKLMVELTGKLCEHIQQEEIKSHVQIFELFTKLVYEHFYGIINRHFKIEIYCDYPMCDINVMNENIAPVEGYDKKGRSIFLQKLEYENLYRFLQVGDIESNDGVYMVTNSSLHGVKEDQRIENIYQRAIEATLSSCHVDIFKSIIQYEKGIYSDHSYNPYIHNDREEIVPFEEEKGNKIPLNFYDNNIKASGKTHWLIEEEKKETEYIIIHYDGETVFNPYHQNVLNPYSVCFYDAKRDNRTEDQIVGGKKIKVRKNNKIFGTLQFIYSDDGTNVFDKFVEKIMEKSNRCLFILNAYNGSKFDHWFLLRSLEKYDLLDRIFMNGNQILNIKFGGRHGSFDLCKLVNKSLKDACESFKTFNKKVEGFDHNIIQEYFNGNKTIHGYFHEKECQTRNFEIKSATIIDLKEKTCEEIGKARLGFNSASNSELYKIVINGSEAKEICKCKKFNELYEYNRLDVLALTELYELVDNVLLPHIPKGKCLFDNKTIGSFVYKLFKGKKSEEGIKTPEYQDLTIYNLTRKGLFAGRCQCYWNNNNVIFYDFSGKDPYVIIDVVSLYPYVMTRREYPCGNMIFYNDKEKQNEKGNKILFDGKKGIYVGKTMDELIKMDGFLSWCSNYKPKIYAMVETYIETQKMKSFKGIMDKGLIGFFFCKTIDQSNLKSTKKILPLRKNGVLNWAHEEIITDMLLNSVDINQLLKHGCKVEIDEEHTLNHYFSETSADLFRAVLQPFEDDKKLQDHYKDISSETDVILELRSMSDNGEFDWFKFEKLIEERDEAKLKYNPAQREMNKNVLNNLSGKIIEQPKYQKTSYVKTQKQLDEIIATANVESIKVLENFGDNKSIMQYDVKDEEACMKETNRPFYLGILIYAYARAHMYESVIRDYDVGYQDTDSAFMRKSELERMMREKPELFGKEFGQFDIEESKKTKKKEFPGLVTIAPKNYFCLDYKPDGSLMVAKKGFKGINIEKDIYLSKDILKEYFKQVQIKHKLDDGTTLIEKYYDKYNEEDIKKRKGLNAKGVTKTIVKSENDNDIKLNCAVNDFKLYTSVLERYRLDKDKNVIAFIEDIIKNKKAYIFTSSLLKQKRGTEKAEGFNLYQRYMLKMISIERKNEDADVGDDN